MIDAAIEQAARRLGVHADSLPPGGGWRITRLAWVPGQGEWTAWFSFGLGDTRGVPDAHLDAPTAALFLLLLGLPEVAVTCPDCQARGSRFEEKEFPRGLTPMVSDGWDCTGGNWELGTRTYSRPCPTCTVDGQPLGQVQREPARLLLDAMPRTAHSLDSMPAREALAVLADQLQAHGDQRGTRVALWLAGPEAFAQALGEVEAELLLSVDALDIARNENS